MGSNLTIGYTYYNQIEAFKYLTEYYKNVSYNFIICDDGSQIHPLTENDMPDNWSLLRIEEDIGFNNEGARNLIAENVNTDWMILIDLDYLLQDIHKIDLDSLKQYKIYSSNINHNQFIIYTEFFKLLEGYPTTGIYGKHGKSVDQQFLNKAELIELPDLKLINNEVEWPDIQMRKKPDRIYK